MNYCVIDLAYGDSGKGTTVDALTRKIGSDLTVLFCGGPQSSHHVVLPDGTWHGFSQFGSGTFAGAKTYISQYRMIEPYALRNEAEALRDKGITFPYQRLIINPFSPVITPWQWRMNRLREQARGNARHGSCGMGIGETRQDELDGFVIRAGQLGDREHLARIYDRKVEQAATLFGEVGRKWLEEYTIDDVCDFHASIRTVLCIQDIPTLAERSNVVYEGSQGFLIDEKYGFAPYHTWSDVTAYNARVLSGGGSNLHVIGVVPCAWTRHGAGPFPSEIPGVNGHDNHNKANDWQGSLRHGKMDLVMLQYALENERVDSIALTKVDQVKWPMPAVWMYADQIQRYETIPFGTPAKKLEALNTMLTPVRDIECLEGMLGCTPISIVSRGPVYTDKEFRKNVIEAAEIAEAVV